MCASEEAITRNSPAMSRFNSRIRSRCSRYLWAMSAIGMSKMSTLCSLMRWSRRSSGPSKFGSAIRKASAAGGGADSSLPGSLDRVSPGPAVWPAFKKLPVPFRGGRAERRTPYQPAGAEINVHSRRRRAFERASAQADGPADALDGGRGQLPRSARPVLEDAVDLSGIAQQLLAAPAGPIEGGVEVLEQLLLVFPVAGSPRLPAALQAL